VTAARPGSGGGPVPAANRATRPVSGTPGGPDQLPAVTSGLSRQNSVYRRTMAVCDKVASAAVRGADASELTTIFARAARKTVVLLDPEFRALAQAGGGEALDTMRPWNPGDASIARLLHVLATERRPLRVPPVPGSALAYGCLAMPVIVGDAVLGYLLVLDETVTEADDVDLIVTSYAATLFALTLAREQTSMELGLRYQGAIVDSLVSGHFMDGQDAYRKARILGIADAQQYRVAVARVSGDQALARPGQAGDQDLAEGLLTRLAGSLRCAAVVRGPELVMIIPEDQPDGTQGHKVSVTPASPGPAIQQLAQQAGSAKLTCGLSEPTRLPELAPQALLQAEHAIDLGLRIGRAGQVICYEELGIYRLLLRIGEMHQLWQFAEDVLGPLIDYDARHKLDLIGTLSVYLSQHESLKQTARVLRVHVNTVSYRIQRIEKLTSLDLGDPDDRLSAHVATKIIESQQAGNGQHIGQAE
jgi:sugar diacid utilization regulator